MGQSATFVDANFPDPTETVLNRDAAEGVPRRRHHGSDAAHNCIVDFGITNGFLFADQYAQQAAADGAACGDDVPRRLCPRCGC
jgi:hypothetical protein